MIKRLLIGTVLGVLGKKFYDEGRLDPYIARARSELDKLGAAAQPDTPVVEPTTASVIRSRAEHQI